MNDIIEIKPGLWWIGSRDPELRTFDDLFPTEQGTTYNAYLIKGSEKTAIIDTVKGERSAEFLAKVKELVDPATVDYYVVNHTEPDHSGSLAEMLRHSPRATVVSSQAAKTFLGNLIHTPFASHVVKDGEVIDLGGKRLRFLIAPFLHWPDTMFSLLEDDGVLFTCDAFGAHYCGDGIFNDELPDYRPDMEFYFDCIMRPFKDKALAAIDKIRAERIEILCPSHGPVIRTDPWKYVGYYEEWCRPAPAARKIVIFYLSPHGNTERMAAAVAKGAALPGIEVVSRHISHLTPGEIRDLMEEGDALIFGIPTINRDVPKPMWDVLAYLSTVKLKGNIAGVFGSYGWSGEACRIAEERLKGLNFKLPAPFLRFPFTPRPEALGQLEGFGRAIAEEILRKP
ncbi:FprA family A-type flavoprotein [Geobacter pickeringii]|uniref:Beta-lactamase n=1 Tax=Geobacter pickeringii TaxID=345632 RepID=A0A0B5BKE2_9BACT|nr:FprA family A-type flavoprotein [Geobacter pickeringii]AJE04531.1 beta-lactamase [Geobacter pickeringii]